MSDSKGKNEKLVDNTIPRDDAIPEEAPAGTKEVKRRRRLSPDETRILAEIFEQTQKPNAALRSRLAQQLDMSSRAVQIWFQNRRAKLKRDASEAQNSYIFDRNRRLSLHLYDRDNNYYMPDGMDGVPRRASYSVGYPQVNQNYQPMMNGQNQYTTTTTGQMNQYSQNNGYATGNSLQPQTNNMTYQNQNVYMGQQQVTHVQPIQERQIQQSIPNEQIMVNNTNNANYNNQNQQQMYIQYQQGTQQVISKQNNGQQIQQIVNPMNYSNNSMPPPSQAQNNQILQQTQNNNQVMGIQQIGIVDQQQTQQNQQQSNNYPLTTGADLNSNSSTTIVQQNNNNGLTVTTSGSNIYNQSQQPMSGQVRNLPSPPLNNNKQMSSPYNYVNNTNPSQNNNQQQNNNSPYMNQNNQQYQQGMINNQPQNIYTGNEPLSPVSKENNNAGAAAGNSTPLNWTTNVVGNEQGINLNMNTNVSTPSYNNSTNQINNNNTTPNFNNNYYLSYPNQKQMNSSYISPVES
ncbi:homeobox-domain-containing protein [Piromyces finnis]|uniref:Homeobox-domain-containing protein n=1 Tax=Piromyces finnis TaxID=1754191 RepID=A0A1Y1VNK3_9FUNG|nr:homeobox-domain-containing protein [Piromyces finnis]|eukprot:ORX60995.1 homeobox-domain-containing protein [Piromyces finnis]